MDQMRKHYAIVRYVLLAAAAATLAIGLALIFFSKPIVDWLGKGTSVNEHFAVYLGTALVGFSITNWLYSKSHDLHALLPAIYGNVVSLAAATIIDCYELYKQTVSSAVWVILALHLVFVIAFLYCLKIIHQAEVAGERW